MIRRAACAVLLLAASCTCGPPEFGCTQFTMPQTLLIITGRPVTMDVSIWESCRRFDVPVTFHVAKSVAVEVFGPSGSPVAFTVSDVSREGGFGSFRNFATVKFTPNAVGTWLVKARFDPDIGNLQQFIPAADARTATPSRTVPAAQLPSTCKQYGVTAQGTVVCGNEPFNDKPDLRTHGGQQIAGQRFAVDGDAVWAMDVEAITRYVDDAGTLVQTHAAPLPAQGQRVRIGAAGGDLWLASSTAQSSFVPKLYRFQPLPDGGLDRTERTMPMGFDVDGIAARADRVLLSSNIDFRPALVRVPDAGQATVMPLPPPQITVGQDPEAIWLLTATGIGVTTDGAPVATQHPLGVQQANPPVLWPSAPAVNTGFPDVPFVFPRVDAGTIWFETLRADGFQAPFVATGTHAFARSNDGQSIGVIDR